MDGCAAPSAHQAGIRTLNTRRFEDEFNRHKIVDAVGDLSLVGYPVIGHLVVERGGHALHTAFAARLLEERGAWELVEAPAAVGVSVTGGTPVGAATVGARYTPSRASLSKETG